MKIFLKDKAVVEDLIADEEKVYARLRPSFQWDVSRSGEDTNAEILAKKH